MDRIEIDHAGMVREVDVKEVIKSLDSGCVLDNDYLSKIIQELVAKCEAMEPLNHNMLDMLKIVDKQTKEIDRLEAELKQLKEENEEAKSNTHGIDWELFATGEIAVQCETEGDAEAFLEEVKNRKYNLSCDSSVWGVNEENTCFRNNYVVNHCIVLYGNKSYYESKDIKVVKWKPDEKEALYDALEDVQVKSTERIKKLVSKIKKQKETIEFYKNQCEELRQSCNNLREENESIKNDKSELILAIENTRDDIEMTADYLKAIIDGFSDSDKFDWKRFKTEDIVVNCKTPKEAIDFIKSAKDHVMIWYDGNILDTKDTRWVAYKDKTCYSYAKVGKGMLVVSVEMSKREKRKIIEWSDYMVKHDE